MYVCVNICVHRALLISNQYMYCARHIVSQLVVVSDLIKILLRSLSAIYSNLSSATGYRNEFGSSAVTPV